MNPRRIARAVFTATLVLTAPAGHGALVDQGDWTLDTATNLLWLDMSKSIGLSARSILDGTDPEHLMDAGWSFASVSQIETFLLDAGMVGPFTGGLSPTNYDSAATLLSLLDVAGGSIQAFSSTSPTPMQLNTPSLLAFPSVGGADLPGPSVPDTASNPGMASWLITPVPEPRTYAMMVVGIGLIGWQLQRKRRRIRATRLC